MSNALVPINRLRRAQPQTLATPVTSVTAAAACEFALERRRGGDGQRGVEERGEEERRRTGCGGEREGGQGAGSPLVMRGK
jgi:hypothetical protein